MKILSIASDSICGGATFSLLNLLRGLKQKGAEISVLTPCAGYLCCELDKIGIPYHIVPYYATVWPPMRTPDDWWKFIPRILRFQGINFIAKRKIRKIIRSYSPDIIHTNVSVINIGYILAKEFGLPHLWHIREYGDKDFNLKPYPSKKILTERISEKSHAIAITRDLGRYYRLNDRGRVIYNGIKAKNDIRSNPDKKSYFIFAGLVSENKGATQLVTAFRDFCRTNPTYRLLFAGRYDEKYLASLKKIIAGSHAENRIDFLGHRTDIEQLMSEACALIVPSRCEGFGRITAEAMFNGCLVIGRDTGGTKEQFDNGLAMTGSEIGIRYLSDSELTEALLAASDMPQEEYLRMTKAAQQVASELYSNEQNIEKSYEFLSEICSGNAPGAHHRNRKQ